MTRPCGDISMARVELRVSGRIDGSGFPSLTTGVVVDRDRLAMVALAGARPVFNLAGSSSALVLLNHLERTATRGPAADVVDALVGVRLEPARLLALLTGCVSVRPQVTATDRVGSIARVTTTDSLVYLAQRDDRWQLAAAEFGDVIADYRRVERGQPREIELRRGAAVRLALRVIEFERNPVMASGVFQLPVPAGFADVPLDDLRHYGPLGRREP
jgi:hypothetical protein